ncbi:WD40 repeat-like protein, partial [Coniophora puteana RWD-64-598 SS2]
MPSDTHSTPDVDDPLRPFVGHTGKITAIEYSPDGRLIATASEDATVRLWDPLTGQQFQKLDTTYRAEGHTGKITAIEYSPDGRLIATASEDASVRLWDPQTGQQIQMIETHWPAHSLTFSPSGLHLATICAEGTPTDAPVGKVMLWGIKEDGEEKRLLTTRNTVHSIEWFPDGHRFITSSKDDDYIRTWDAETGEQVRKDLFRGDNITAIEYSPDGRLIATASLDDTVRLWDPVTGQALQK